MASADAYSVGEARITRLPEITAKFAATTLLPGFEPRADTPGLSKVELASGELENSVHAWLVRLGERVILIDAGIGNGKPRSLPPFNDLHTPFLDRLEDAGVRPEQVTDVLITHLHTDHVGWLTVQREDGWVPTFGNARVYLPHVGYDWFMTGGGSASPNRAMFVDSVLPVVEAGQALFVPAAGGAAADGFSYMPTPGHSPDHMSIVLRSAGAAAIFPGDVLHHAVQVAAPELSSMFCADPAQARDSRKRALEVAAAEDLTWFSSHFPSPSAGRIGRVADGYRWQGL